MRLALGVGLLALAPSFSSGPAIQSLNTSASFAQANFLSTCNQGGAGPSYQCNAYNGNRMVVSAAIAGGTVSDTRVQAT